MKRTGPGPRCLHTHKIQFSEHRAKKKAAEKRAISINGYMKAYKCMFCEWWHITHQHQRQ